MTSTAASLYSLARNAGATLTTKAYELRSQLEETGGMRLLGDFESEQRKFIEEQQKKKTTSDTSALPWDGYGEQTNLLKKNILSLTLV